MSAIGIGNSLNGIVWRARASLFDQGELAELTYNAFDLAARQVQSFDKEPIELTFPLGYKPDRTTIPGQRSYSKAELVQRYQFLAVRQLSINAIIQMVTIVEAMLTDVLRTIIVRYPQKLGAKRSITIQTVLESGSLEEVHFRAADSLVNELSYKAPADFAGEFAALTGVNLLECPAYHCYMEVKASRDIFVHNSGVANSIYVKKAGSHARVTSNVPLPSDVQYLLESYEHCLQVSDWLEIRLHESWDSSEYERRREPQLPLNLASSPSHNPNVPRLEEPDSSDD